MKYEDNPRGFLLLIVQTISGVLIWMIANVLAGIYFGLGFFEKLPRWPNYVYYVIMLVSFYFLVKYLRRKWDL
jgi:hypothetical protein